MEEIRYQDTEGRDVWLFKPRPLHWEWWSIRVNDKPVGGVEKTEAGKWEGKSAVIDSSDIEALAWVVEQYEMSKKRN